MVQVMDMQRRLHLWMDQGVGDPSSSSSSHLWDGVGEPLDAPPEQPQGTAGEQVAREVEERTQECRLLLDLYRELCSLREELAPS